MNIPARRQGFTLIEVLVVISIISLLIAILLPALQSAREHGRTVVCLSNHRQLFQGIAMYTHESNGWWPVGAGRSGNTAVSPHGPTWARVVAHQLSLRYIREQNEPTAYGAGLQPRDINATVRPNGIFQCPSEDFPNAWDGKNATSYRWNCGYTYGMGISDSYTLSTSPNYPEQYGRVAESALLRPVSTFILGESDVIRTNKTKAAEYDMDQFGKLENAGTWHTGSGNYLWGDGHATTVHATNLSLSDFDRRE